MHLLQCIMKCLERDFFPYAITSFNFCEKKHQKDNLLHPFLFYIIHKSIGRSHGSHDKCVTLHLIDLCVLISQNMFKREIFEVSFLPLKVWRIDVKTVIINSTPFFGYLVLTESSVRGRRRVRKTIIFTSLTWVFKLGIDVQWCKIVYNL